MTWPPDLPTLKVDGGIPAEDTEDDAALELRLDAAVSFVQRRRKDAFALDDDGHPVEPIGFSERGELEASSLLLGTLMLAHRLFARRRSPDIVLWMAETGTTRVPFEDRDLVRMLGLHKPRVG
ncbi:MAG: hypothetical protein ACRD0W_00295 [Acidimicrobiales bacterium]